MKFNSKTNKSIIRRNGNFFFKNNLLEVGKGREKERQKRKNDKIFWSELLTKTTKNLNKVQSQKYQLSQLFKNGFITIEAEFKKTNLDNGKETIKKIDRKMTVREGMGELIKFESRLKRQIKRYQEKLLSKDTFTSVPTTEAVAKS